ncbi:MAG TPA: helix-hairpin-helix domain-containing protein [Candidatus Dormibacteraeota bacterium]|nr:helix-hairpin-helix domain-containing protein [Candidatus Dormibacteraeota bacterium]
MRIPLRIIPGWRRIALLVVPFTIAVAGVAATYAYTSSHAAAPPPPIANPVLDVPASPGLLIDVSGAVESPGLYRLPRGDRVFDAIAAAGGLSPDADLSKLPNLAGRLKDGEQVKVAFAKTTSGTIIVRVNLNTATLEELETVPGFTSAFAQDCIDYRTNYGGFQNTRELVDILGMSEAAYLIARKYLTL